MRRRCPAPAVPLPPLAHEGRLAQLAAERFPATRAPMSQSDLAAYWLGEYVKALRDLPHLKPSELLALIKEQDEAATGATFTRTIKSLAKSHLGDRTNAAPSPTPGPRSKVSRSVQHAAAPSSSSIDKVGAAPSPTPLSGTDHYEESIVDADLIQRIARMHATPPGGQQA